MPAWWPSCTINIKTLFTPFDWKKACHCSYHRWCRLLGTLLFFYPPPYCWQPVLLHTFSYNRQQKCFLFHVTAIINLTGQSANNSCCTVFNCSRASWEQHKHPPLLIKQTWCESCATYLPLYLILRGKHRCACCTQMSLKKIICYKKKQKTVEKLTSYTNYVWIK